MVMDVFMDQFLARPIQNLELINPRCSVMCSTLEKFAINNICDPKFDIMVLS